MSSPFTSVANAKLVFPVLSSGLVEDDYGNKVPIKSSITVVALLQTIKKTGTTLPDRYKKAGLDVNSKLFEGYLVDPLELPVSLQPPCIGTGEIKTATNRIESGKVELIPVSQNPFVVSAGVKEVTKIIVLFATEVTYAV